MRQTFADMIFSFLEKRQLALPMTDERYGGRSRSVVDPEESLTASQKNIES
jgi:hypothetical protein